MDRTMKVKVLKLMFDAATNASYDALGVPRPESFQVVPSLKSICGALLRVSRPGPTSGGGAWACARSDDGDAV